MDHRERLAIVLDGYLHNSTCSPLPDNMTEEDWNQFFLLAWQHMVLPAVCAAVRRMPSFKAYSKSDAAYRRSVYMAAEQAMRTQTLLALLPQLAAAGVHYTVLKGVICRSLYAQPDLRPSSDEDIFLPAKEKETCLRVLLRAGYRRDKENDDEAWISPNNRLRIEFSYGKLFPQEGDIFEKLNRLFSDAVQGERMLLQVQGQTVYTLLPTENMLYLLAHALKHFIYSGFGLRQLMDISAFAEQYGGQIDWLRLFRTLDSLHAGEWTRSLFLLCREHFGLDTKACGVEAAGPLPVQAGSLWDDILSAGVFGQSSSARLHSSSVTLGAIEQKKHPFLHACFPKAAVLEARYPYVRFRPLLPVAWVHRMVRYAGEHRHERKKGEKTDGSVAVGRQRLSLLQEYGLL